MCVSPVDGIRHGRDARGTREMLILLTNDDGIQAPGLVAMYRELVKLGVGEKDTHAMVAVVEAADLTKLPVDAYSLREWLERATAEIPPLCT